MFERVRFCKLAKGLLSFGAWYQLYCIVFCLVMLPDEEKNVAEIDAIDADYQNRMDVLEKRLELKWVAVLMTDSIS